MISAYIATVLSYSNKTISDNNNDAMYNNNLKTNNNKLVNNCTRIFFEILCVSVNEPVQIVAQWLAFSEHVEQVPQVQQFNGGHEQPVVLIGKP